MIKVILKSFVLIWLWYFSILLGQYFFGTFKIPSDGVMEVGFPYIFYSDSAWYDTPRYSKHNFIGNIKVITFLAVLYASIRAIIHYRSHGSSHS